MATSEIMARQIPDSELVIVDWVGTLFNWNVRTRSTVPFSESFLMERCDTPTGAIYC